MFIVADLVSLMSSSQAKGTKATSLRNEVDLVPLACEGALMATVTCFRVFLHCKYIAGSCKMIREILPFFFGRAFFFGITQTISF